ncbi:MAG TPA: hypothetical protein DIW47_08180 [Bacteroidetes bacterium]|nr:hypothetical protein [Bacteroidota bacterium]
MSTWYSKFLVIINEELSPYTVGLLLILFLTYYYRKSVSSEFRRLFPLLIYWPISEFVGIATRREYVSNTHVHHVYTVVYYLLLIYYFYPLLKAEKGMKFYFIASSILLFAFTVLNAMLFQPFMVAMPTNAIMFHCLFILVIALFSFKQMLANPIPTLLRYKSQFWISTGLLIFNSWVFFFFALHAYFLRIGGDYPRSFLNIPSIFAFVMLLLFLLAFWAEVKTNQFRHEHSAK